MNSDCRSPLRHRNGNDGDDDDRVVCESNVAAVPYLDLGLDGLDDLDGRGADGDDDDDDDEVSNNQRLDALPRTIRDR